MPLTISPTITIPDEELEISAVRAQGAGVHNDNKVASAVHLRFDVRASQALPEQVKQRLLERSDHRITADGIVIIKSQEHRSQEKNKEAAFERLRELIASALVTRKPRKKTKPSKSARAARLDRKTRHGRLKKSRGKIDSE